MERDHSDHFAKEIIETLISHGVSTFCISPGSRSAPLTLAAANHPLADTVVHYDERGTAFHALGYAKGSESPVAIIVTGGTAVGNLLPAVIESSYAKVPLILLTADRPPELRDTGSRQTIDQVKIFQNFVRYQIDLPPPSTLLPSSYISTTIVQALSHAISPPKGPVQINCMFREPLSSPIYLSSLPFSSTGPSLTLGKSALSRKQIDVLGQELAQHKKGVILVSYLPSAVDYQPLYILSAMLSWPIFPTLPSPLRSLGFREGLIPHYDLLLHSLSLGEEYAFDAVLQLGECYVSQTFLSWIDKQKPLLYMHVSEDPLSSDPSRAITHRVISDPLDFCRQCTLSLFPQKKSSWLSLWEERERTIEEVLPSLFNRNGFITEAHIFHTLSSLLSEESSLFLSVSMTIREADLFFSSKRPIASIHANRGASGIDGNIATSIGLARALRKPFLALLGDLAFLHDLNSLSQLSSLHYPICFLLFNNQGGGIFSQFSALKNEPSFEHFFKTPHQIDFVSIATLFHLHHILLTQLEDLPKALEQSKKKHTLVEVPTSAETTYALHQEIFSSLRKIFDQKEPRFTPPQAISPPLGEEQPHTRTERVQAFLQYPLIKS